MASGPRVTAKSRAGDELIQPRRLTRRGLATRDRIVRAAATLMYTKGVNGTTLDNVRTASGTSKSQLYRHFVDKESLVQEVISLRAHDVLARQRQRLERLESIRGVRLSLRGRLRSHALRDGAASGEVGAVAGR